jgi:hypothetical protein
VNRRAPWIWAVLLASLWIVMILCTHWEPVMRDGWGNLHWHDANTLDLRAAWRLVMDGWLGSNPRLGQTVTTLLYAPGPYHVIITPLLELALLWVMTAIVLGRWPSVRRADDALVFATTTAIFALCTPQFGPMLFYRPFMGNYTFGLLVNLVWLVPYRLHVEAPRSERWWLTPLVFALGVAAGMCNEHTGPTFLALGIAAVVWSVRQNTGIRVWMIAGLLALAAGYVLLLLAPGHAARYGGLAQQAGLIDRVLERGLGENLVIVTVLVVYMLWSLPWIALAFVARRRSAPEPMSARSRYVLWALVAAGVLATFVLLGSPKLGKRLYVHSVALVAMGLSGAVIAQLAAPWAKKAAAAFAVVALLYVEARCLITYARVGPVGAERVAIIREAAPGASVVVPRFPIGAGTWFLGDDLPGTWQNTAAMFGLARIQLSPK